MTLPDETKQPLLRNFHKHTLTPGWTFKDNGPNEADRQLLVEYDNVVEELRMLSPSYVARIFCSHDQVDPRVTGMPSPAADY